MRSEFKYYVVYKPYGMMSQFSRENDNPTLADLNFDFPKDVYPVGRLDHDSEGLLLLTNDTSLNKKLLNPDFMHNRTYWVQVEGQIDNDAVSKLTRGVEISINGKRHKTLPSVVTLISEPTLPERIPPIRFRLSVPTSWVSISLVEGKNRQVRRMTASVGFPTLRLVRWSIEGIRLGMLLPGEVKSFSQDSVYGALFKGKVLEIR